MNIGICLQHREPNPEKVFADAAGYGFHHGQLISWNPSLWTEEEAENIRRLCSKYEIEITAFWCGWEGPKRWNFTEGPETLGLVPESFRFRRLQNLLDGAAFARRLGVKDIVTHMGFMPENMTDPHWPGICAAIKALALELKSHNQNLLFETGQETPVVLLRLFETVGTGNLFINLDPANLILYGKANPVDALDVIGNYIRGVHAKDGRYPTGGRELGDETRIGEGKVNFPALLRGLHAHGFDGSLTIEREIEGEEQIRDILESRTYLNSILQEMEKETPAPSMRVGMVGMGGISQSHIEAWKLIPEAEVVCVCDIRPEKADAAARVTGATPYTDFDTMLAAESFDVLDICLPTYLHPEFSIKGLNHGLDVLCEKPISLYRKDVERINAAAKANGKHFMVAQVVRFWPEYVALREAYEKKTYGKLLSGSMSRLGNVPRWSWDNWMKDPARSGLVPFDLHIHDLDFLVSAFGKPTSLRCHRATEQDQDYLNVVYEYPDFFIATEAAWYRCGYHFRCSFRFQFEHAVMEYVNGRLTIFHEGGEAEVREPECGTRNGINLPDTNAYYNEIRYFTDQILSGKPIDRVPPAELETVLTMIDEINEKED